MRSILNYERRLQDLERASQNKFRIGKIKEVQFAKRRWYVRMEQNPLQVSGGGAGGGQQQGAGGQDVLLTDWIPWKSFSHGSIQFSVPPRVDQTVAINSPNGWPEMSYCEPYHYDPDHPAPHDKENEVFMKIQAPSTGGGQAKPKPDALKPGDVDAASGEASGSVSNTIDTPENKGDFLTVHATKDFLRIQHNGSMVEIAGGTAKVYSGKVDVTATGSINFKAPLINMEANSFVAKTGNVNWSNG